MVNHMVSTDGVINWTTNYKPTTYPSERYRFPLADEAAVELRFYGRRPTPADIDLLREQLAIAQRALGASEQE